MFGSIGFPELLLIFIVVLLVFGPQKLPEFARLLGKTIREFRSTVDEAKTAIENEMYKEGLTGELKNIGKDITDTLNVYEKDIGKDVKDAMNVYENDIDPKPELKKEQPPDEKKSE